MSNLLEQLKRDEGLHLFPYKDSAGKLTIGYGRNLDDNGISEDEAYILLVNDIDRVRTQLARAVPWYRDMNHPAREAVLENMAFNLGTAGLMRFTRALEAVRAGVYNDAAKHMLHSLWAKQVGQRAERLAEQMRKGEWV